MFPKLNYLLLITFLWGYLRVRSLELGFDALVLKGSDQI